MSKLPAPLYRWWPLLKRGHRILTTWLGILFRLVSPVLGRRGVPRRATPQSVQTATREPDAVRLHAGAVEERLERRLPPGEPARHPVFRAGAAVTVPARYVLEVRDGVLSGDFGATITPGKVLDYQTSGYFGIDSWREHPLYLRPTIGTVTHVPGTVLSLANRGASSNYYHFLYDAIARLGITEECLPEARYDAVVVAHQTRYQRQLLDMVGLAAYGREGREPRLVQPRAGQAVSADHLVVPSTPNQDLVAPPSSVRWLRERLRPSGAVDGGLRLYLTRGNVPRTRRYVQEPELLPALEQRGFLIVDPGTFSVQEQIDLFHAADVVVAPHGAGLTNITFCRPEARVLELFTPSYVHLGLWAIADAVGLDYRYLALDESRRGSVSSGSPYDDVSIPAARVEAEIDDLLG